MVHVVVYIVCTEHIRRSHPSLSLYQLKLPPQVHTQIHTLSSCGFVERILSPIQIPFYLRSNLVTDFEPVAATPPVHPSSLTS